MTRSSDHSPVILLGDHETVAHRDELAKDAAQHDCVIVDAFTYPPGRPASTADLAAVDAVVSALGRAIADRRDIWLPFPKPDLGREQHLRRLILVLQRHGLNLRLGREVAACPTNGGMNEIDYALRREVQIVDELDHAALAAVGAESLGHEIERVLVAAGGAAPSAPPRPAPTAAVTGGGADASTDRLAPPRLPAPTDPWGQRQPVLKRYVRWLVHGCGVTQSATARVLNSAGQRTPKGRRWQPATVAALLNGRYDRGAAAR